MYCEKKIESNEIPVISTNCKVFVYQEDGEKITQEKNDDIHIPVFEISFRPTFSLDENGKFKVKDFSDVINSAHDELEKKVEKLYKEPYKCKTVIGLNRSNWKSLPIIGRPKGPCVDDLNLYELLKDIQSHNCKNKKITSFDFPLDLQVGFCCSCGKNWLISLLKIKSCLSEFSDKEKNVLLFDRLRTPEGRNEIAKGLNNETLIADCEINEEMEPGNGFFDSSLVYFRSLGLFGIDGDISDIKFKSKK